MDNPAIPDHRKLEREYSSKLEVYENMLSDFQKEVYDAVKIESVNITMKYRVKKFESYYGKLLRRMKKYEGSPKAYDITDVLAMRVICPFSENLSVIENLIKKNFTIAETEDKRNRHSFNQFGYSSVHLLASVPLHITRKYGIEQDGICEIQLCTTLQDAWAEVEHELIYKKEFSPFDEPLKRKLAALNANLTLSDILFQEILDYQRGLQAELRKRRNQFFAVVNERESKHESANSSHPAGSEGVDGRKQDRLFKIRFENKSIDELLLFALEEHNNSRFEQAIKVYSHILDTDAPNNVKSIIYLHRGMAYFVESDYRKSTEDFTRALEIEPDNFKALFYRGVVYRTLQDYSSALKDLEKCVELEPYNYNGYFARAQVYFHLRDYPKALSDCEFALKLNPESEKVLKLRKTLKYGIDLTLY